LVTQVTPTQPLAHSSPLSHESGNIPTSFFPHMHTPSALLGRPIGQMVNSQVIHTTMVTQDTQPPYHTSKISTPYIGGQYSMGGQPSAGGKPSVAGKIFTGGNLHGCNIKNIGGKPLLQVLLSLLPLVYILGHPYPGVVNPLWTQPNQTGHSSARNYALSIRKPHNSNATVPPLPPPYIGDQQVNRQYVGGPSVQSQYMGGQTGQPPYIGGQPGKHLIWEDHLVLSSRHNLDMFLLVFPCNMVITSINNLTDNYRSWLR
jgi:hypothetical protein